MKFVFVLVVLFQATTVQGYVQSVVVAKPPYFTISKGLPFLLHRRIVAHGFLTMDYVEQQAHRFGFPNFATVFRYAAFDNYADVVEELAKLGAGELNRDDFNDALVALVSRDTSRLLTRIDDLQEASARLNLHSVSSDGRVTPHVYVREVSNRRIDSQARQQVVEVLVGLGAEIEDLRMVTRADKEDTALSRQEATLAVAAEDVDELKKLFMRAVYWGQEDVLRYLVTHDVDAYVDLDAAIRGAAIFAHPHSMIKFLAELGANPNKALRWAAMRGNDSIVALAIEELGATNLDAALLIAMLTSNWHTVELLAQLRLSQSDKKLSYAPDWQWRSFAHTTFDFTHLLPAIQELDLSVSGDPLF